MLGCLASLPAIAMVFVIVVAGNSLDAWSATRQWRSFNPSLRLLERRESRYQNISVLEYAGQRNVYGSGRLLFSVPDEKKLDAEAEEGANAAFAHLALTQHVAPQTVLMIGGGANGILREVLKHPVTRVDYVEFDSLLLEATRRWLPAIDKKALEDSRVRIHEIDGRRFVALAEEGAYDVALSFLSDPTTLGMNRLFTREFFELASRALRKDGVFITGMTSAPSPRGVLADANATIYHTLRSVFKHVIFLPGGDSGLFLATNGESQLLRKPEDLHARFVSRHVESSRFDPQVFFLMVEENEVLWANYLLNRHGRRQPGAAGTNAPEGATADDKAAAGEITQLTVASLPLGGGAAIEAMELDRERFINTDANPIAVVYSLLVWGRFANPEKRDALDWLLLVRFWWIWPAVGGLIFVAFVLRLVGGRAGAKDGPAGVASPLEKGVRGLSPQSLGHDVDTPLSPLDRGEWPDDGKTEWLPAGRGVRKLGLLVLAASCGFSGMAVQLVLLLAFQNVVGHVYGLIGALVAAFMAGLAIGARLAARARACAEGGDGSARGAVCWIIVSRAGLMAVAYLVLALLVMSGSEGVGGAIGTALFFLANAVAGCFTGLCFPLFTAIWRNDVVQASRLCDAGADNAAHDEGSAAGWLYGADLMGACVGSLIVGAVAIPVLGLWLACHLVLVVSAAGLAFFGIVSPRSASSETENCAVQ